MIICFEGTPGSGKSYEAIKKVLDNLKLGRTVYTNIDGLDEGICREHIKSYTGLDDYEIGTRLVFVPYHKIYDFYNVNKSGILFVIDEVHKYYGAREWQKDSNKAFANWASTHRKQGHDVVLVTQNLEKVDSHIRSLVEWTYRYKKLNMFGRLFTNGYRVQSYVEDDTSGKALETRVHRYDSRIYPCYQSYTVSDIKELKIMKHTNILMHPVFLIFPICLAVFLYLVFFKSSFATGDLFGAKKIIARSENIKDKPLSERITTPVPVGASVPVFMSPSVPVAPVSIPTSVASFSKIEAFNYGDYNQVRSSCLSGGFASFDSIVLEIFNCSDVIVTFKGRVLQTIKRVKEQAGVSGVTASPAALAFK